MRIQLATAAEATLTTERRRVIDSILTRADEAEGGLASTFTQANFNLERAKEIAHIPALTEATTPLTGPTTFYDKEIAHAITKKLDLEGSPFLRPLYAVASATRNTKSAVDFSALAVQGLFGVTRSSKIATGQLSASVKALVSPFSERQYMRRFIAENIDTVMKMVDNGAIFRSSDVMEGLEQGGWLARYVVRSTHDIPNEAQRLPTASRHPFNRQILPHLHQFIRGAH